MSVTFTIATIASCLTAGTVVGRMRALRQLNRRPVNSISDIDDCPTVYADGSPANDDSECDHDFDRGGLANCKHCGMPWNGGARTI